MEQQFISIDGADYVVIKTYTNADEEMQSFVVGGLRGWHVCLKDLDSNEFLPQVRIFP